MEQDFFINDRILIKPSVNTIINPEGKEVRVEQRVMQVLLMLAKAPGQIVLREKIVTEVWNDYGGADEGLNQVISILRKTLNDTGKTLIETVPKKGYILNAIVTNEKQKGIEETKEEIPMQESLQPTSNKTSNKKIKYVVIAAAIILVLLIVVYLLTHNKPTSPDIYNSNNTEQRTTDTSDHGADVAPDTIHK